MIYTERTYRDTFSKERLEFFSVIVKETDLWIGIDKNSFCDSMVHFCEQQIIELRNTLDAFIDKAPNFKSSLQPIPFEDNIPIQAKEMIIASTKADIGPMGSVAGCFANYLGEKIMDNYDVKELIIENGGDIFVKIEEALSVSVFAGDSPFSEKVGVIIPKGCYGICTSSGTIGHSYSEGITDALMVVCENPLLADAYATSLANKVKSKYDVESVIKLAKSKIEILSCIIICQDYVGICGNFEFVSFINESSFKENNYKYDKQ